MTRHIQHWHDPRVALLAEMLTYCRPVDSAAEAQFCNRYLATIPGIWADDCGNYHLHIGDSPVIWSCHTDTVHRVGGRQRLWVTDGMIGLRPRSRSTCLGADDTVGVWLMCEMIRAGVPGHYVFHYGEEVGGIGSRAVVEAHPEYFEGARFCIALDRAGVADVITHQAGGRCCSDVFAESLAAGLHASGIAGYAPCDHGVYTDSAEYTGIVGECTNLSVGYYRQHSPDEYTDTRHAVALLDALIALDQSALVYERQPGEINPIDARFRAMWDKAEAEEAWDAWPDGDATPDDTDEREIACMGISVEDWLSLTPEDRATFKRMMGVK